VLAGWVGPTCGWAGLLAGNTAYFLEAERYAGIKLPAFPDSLSIFNNSQTWHNLTRLQMCPEDTAWGPSYAQGSYSNDLGCWQTYWIGTTGGADVYRPATTQYFKFGGIRKPEQSVMLSEVLHHCGYIMDATSQTGNVWDSAYAAGGWLAARHFHPGMGKIPATAGQYYWEGTNNYLFFEGHVEGLQYPPYDFSPSGGPIPINSNLKTYTNFVKQ
jgi:hypothetical protein